MEMPIKNKTISITRLLIIFLIVFFVFIKMMLVRDPYNFISAVNETENELTSSLGNFLVPPNYHLIAKAKGEKGENILLVYPNNEKRRTLFISRLREHLSDNLDNIQVLDRTRVETTASMSEVRIIAVPSFRFTYLLPLPFRRDDLSGMGDEAIVKGMNVKVRERFETDSAAILYLGGEFTKIGLYKEPQGRWYYPTPVFDFETLHEGALAFIKSKKSGKVVVAVSANYLDQFDEKEFRKFVERFEPA